MQLLKDITIEQVINAYCQNKLNNSNNFKQFAKLCGMYYSDSELADMWVDKWTKYYEH